MSTIRLHIRVAPDRTISGVAPADLPPGEHEVTVSSGPAVTPPSRPFRMADFPVDNGPWDNSVSLRREDCGKVAEGRWPRLGRGKTVPPGTGAAIPLAE